MTDNYILMLSALPENGWELGEPYQYMDFCTDTGRKMKLGRIETGMLPSRHDYIPLWHEGDLLRFAGIDTVEGFEDFVSGMLDETEYDITDRYISNNVTTRWETEPYFKKEYKRFKSVRELLLAYAVKEVLNKTWNHEKGEWEER